MKSFSKRGITLIELVVVIIILLLLAIIAIFGTRKVSEKAEAASVISEFKSVYTSVTAMKDMYNSGYDLIEGQDYCEKISDASGDSWYVIYGLQDGDKYNEELVNKHLGMDELKRSYEFRIYEKKFNSDVEVRYYDGRYTVVSGYNIRSYDDIKNVSPEITR